MIRELDSLDFCAAFIEDLNSDPAYSDPMLSSPEEREDNLYYKVGKEYAHVLGTFEEGVMNGLFVFDVWEEDRYIEMSVGLSRFVSAYEEVMDWLAAQYPGYQNDFVFNPANDAIRTALQKRGAAFDVPQYKMVLTDEHVTADSRGIELLSDAYLDQYLAMHLKDCYWTGEKVAAADRFRTFLAVDGGTVVGYLDVTCIYDENEVYELRVKEEYRGRGWGRKLMTTAVERNRPNGLILTVEVDNAPALHLYDSLGFVPVPGGTSQTATWHMP